MTGIQIFTSGPLFQGSGRLLDELRSTIEASRREVIEIGQERLEERFRPRPAGVYLSIEEAAPGKYSQGHYRRNLHADVARGTIDDSGVIYGPWLEGTSSRNQTSRFKGYRVWRQTRQWLQTEVVPDVVGRRVKRMVERLS